MTENRIDEKKLAEAKEKLACHIRPPKPATAAQTEGASSNAARNAGVSCGITAPQQSFIADDGRVLLTQMTSAGG